VITQFDNEEHYDQMVLLKDIEFYSTCEHHFLPFFGKVHIAYIPKDKVLGISKLSRIVDCFARRLQVQERLTMQIANFIQDELNPLGVGVIIKAQHLCMIARGVKQHEAMMVTSALKGEFKDNAITRNEFLSILK
jgi:GTP cyclohydrolase I